MAVDLNSVTIEPALKERIAKLADVSGGPGSAMHQQPDVPHARKLLPSAWRAVLIACRGLAVRRYRMRVSLSSMS